MSERVDSKNREIHDKIRNYDGINDCMKDFVWKIIYRELDHSYKGHTKYNYKDEYMELVDKCSGGA